MPSVHVKKVQVETSENVFTDFPVFSSSFSVFSEEIEDTELREDFKTRKQGWHDWILIGSCYGSSNDTALAFLLQAFLNSDTVNIQYLIDGITVGYIATGLISTIGLSGNVDSLELITFKILGNSGIAIPGLNLITEDFRLLLTENNIELVKEN